MYDKSKKTWSQRLKITKSEKTAYTTTASVVTSAAKFAPKNGQNLVSHEQQQLPQQRLQIQSHFASGGGSSGCSNSSNANNTHYQNMHLSGAFKFSDYQNVNVGYTTEYNGSASARSIKYAEPWIYSTVRGIPARPYHHVYQQTVPRYAHPHAHPHAAAIFASPPLTTTEALAVVICSCSEYLNGTKRDVKKASICKKCKGSRLPLTTIRSAMPAAKLCAATNGAAATMRVVSMTKKARPTILNPQKDPYDMMRRTRLLSPEPSNAATATTSSSNNAVKEKVRARGKSASPTRARGRSRTRNQPATLRIEKTNNSTAGSQHLDNCWLIEEDDELQRSNNSGDSSMMHTSSKSTIQARRSILRCKLNPYDLISNESNNKLSSSTTSTAPTTTSTRKSSQISNGSLAASSSTSQNEFLAPTDDDFNVEDAALNEDEPPFNVSSQSECSISSIKSTKIRGTCGSANINQNANTRKANIPSTSSATIQKKSAQKSVTVDNSLHDVASSMNYTTNVQAIAGQRISLGKQKSTKKSLIKQSGDSHFYESIVIGDIEENVESATLKIKIENAAETNKRMQQSVKTSKHNTAVQQTQPQRPPRGKKQDSSNSDTAAETIEQNKNHNKNVTATNNAAEAATHMTPSPTPTHATRTQQIKSILKRPTSRTSNDGETTGDAPTTIANETISTVSIAYNDSSAGNGNTKTTTTVSINQQQAASKSSTQTPTPTLTQSASTVATSQFYIPLPQQSRKKVQFMMEDKIIHNVDLLSTTKDCEKKQAAWHKANDHDSSVNDNCLDVAVPSTLAKEPLHKLSSNYEYYNKKRQQGQQQEKSASTIKPTHKIQTNHLNDIYENNDGEPQLTSNIPAINANLQANILQKIQQESEKVTKTLNKTMEKTCKKQKSNENDIEEILSNKSFDNTSTMMQVKNVSGILHANADESNSDYTKNATECENLLDNVKEIGTSIDSDSISFHYEEVLITNDNCKEQMSFNKTQSPDLTAAASMAAVNSTLELMEISENCSSGDRTTSGTTSLTTATTFQSAVAVPNSSAIASSNDESVNTTDDYDDVTCEKLKALVAGDSSARTTQSRHPIRRSHSERMPIYSKLTSVGIENDDTAKNTKVSHTTNCDRSSTTNGNGGGNRNRYNDELNSNHIRNSALNFKDTTALRFKSYQHRDSRNLFPHNGSQAANTKTTSALSFGRPKEPPPPPPPTLAAVALTPPAQDKTGSVAEHYTEHSATIKRLTSTKVVNATETPTNIKESILSQTPKAQTEQVDMNDKKKNFANAVVPSVTKQTALITATDLTKATTTTTQATTSAYHSIAEKGLQSQKQTEIQQQQQQQHNINSHEKSLHINEDFQKNFFNKETAMSPKSNATTTRTKKSLKCFVDNKDNEQTLNKTDAGKCEQHEQEQHQQKLKNLNTMTCAMTTKTASATKVTKDSTSNSQAIFDSFNIQVKPSTTTNSPQRTVVRVAPFNKVSSSGVHRLKINHSDNDLPCNAIAETFSKQNNESAFINNDDEPNFGQKKTSILINGDDCYSTMNLSLDTSMPIYQSSVVVADYSSPTIAMENIEISSNNTNGCIFTYEGLKVTTTSNTVTINLSSASSNNTEKEYNNMQQQNGQTNKNRTRPVKTSIENGFGKAIIPITVEQGLQRSSSSTSSASSTSSMASSSCCNGSGSDSGHGTRLQKRERTLIKLDYDSVSTPIKQSTKELPSENQQLKALCSAALLNKEQSDFVSHEEELLKILRNPVEAVKRNLVPHVCGKTDDNVGTREIARNKKMKENCINVDSDTITKPKLNEATVGEISPETTLLRTKHNSNSKKFTERNSFIAKLLEDATLSQVAHGLETDTVAELIENSLKRLKNSRNVIDISGTKDNDDMNRLITLSLRKIQEERQSLLSSNSVNRNSLNVSCKEEDHHSNRGSISSANSFASANNYELFDFDANESDCYQSCSSEITTAGEDDISSAETRTKFYQMLVDATLAEIELNGNVENDEHHYESIRNNNGDPIYEEINDIPPPLPLSAPPTSEAELEKKVSRSIFEGASKYDILSYLVEAKERGVVREEPPFEYNANCTNPIIIEEEATDTLSELCKRNQKKDNSSRASILSDSSEENLSTMSSLSPPPLHSFICGSGSTDLLSRKSATNEIERNDSGVGSETSKSSRSKFQCANAALISKNSPIHLCEDCDGPVEIQITDSGVMFAPLVCRKCSKKRVERKEIITEIVETEEKYGRDLQIILEEFYHPMLVAGLLTQEQLSAIFLNTEELLENSQTLAERMRDALDIALEQGDDDFLTVNIGRIFLDFTQMLHAFESYCVRQAGASLLLANLEKEKELLRIFLKVSQMENAVLRRMNLNSFLMVPVQRVTKYPLLLARLYKVTPTHLEGRDLLKQAQEKIELHLNHINQEAKDVPTKLWRRISSSSPNRRASCEIDMINIKLRKMAIDILEWNHDEVRFVMEGKLLFTQPTDSNWKKARSIKLTPVNALLVTNGKPSANYKAEKVMSDKLNFPKHTGIREASLLVMKEKCGRYTLIREPLYLDRCVVCSEADWDDYFEVQEISSKDTFIFKAEDGVRTKLWYTQLQYHAQGMGSWRKRRNALANIMINGMLTRS